MCMNVTPVAMTPTPPPNLSKWLSWLGQIQQDILELGENRATFRSYSKTCRPTPRRLRVHGCR
jgi:hypothetical protein